MSETITKLHGLLDAMEGAEHLYQEQAIMMEFLPYARDLLKIAEAAKVVVDNPYMEEINILNVTLAALEEDV
jgi:hypothetical protein